MSEREYRIADDQVIRMVNRKASRLPSKMVTFIPTERVERVEALDLRIQQLQKITPYAGAAILAIVSLLIGRMM